MPVLAAGSALAWSALPFAAVRILVHQGHSRRELNDLKEREKVERKKHSSPFNTLKKTALSVKFFLQKHRIHISTIFPHPRWQKICSSPTSEIQSLCH